MRKVYQNPQAVIYHIYSKGSMAQISNTSNNADIDYKGEGGDHDAYVKEDRGFDIWGEDNN